MATNKQIELWKGDYGNHYQDNKNPWHEETAREIVWGQLLSTMKPVPNSFIEVGPAQGLNLRILKRIYDNGNIPVSFAAVEINDKARERLKDFNAQEDFTNLKADCVFTWGVLIHVHPNNLVEIMQKIYDASTKYIICCEYFNPHTIELKYPEIYGGYEYSWACDYGLCWIEEFKVKLLGYSFCWQYATGLDNVVCWVFEKNG